MTEHEKTAWRRAASQDDQPLSQRVLSRWDNEGGATPYGPQEAVGDEALAEGLVAPKAGKSPPTGSLAGPKAAPRAGSRLRS